MAAQANYFSDHDTQQQKPREKGSSQCTVSLTFLAFTEGQPGCPAGLDCWLSAAVCGQGRVVRAAGTLGARPPPQVRPRKSQRELVTAEHLRQEGQVHSAINVQFICDWEQHIWDVTADCRVKQPAELGCFGGSSRL